ncbi:toll/interleukin-1 receptor domain-containing protein [uncultured Catenibacterium sp.]|uniref:toll/interleukin-1 receptor domain-containing protein n=1 Tax=uncultured Catenibacterium sp. TaxID=286142 RepID=UPI0025D1D6AF|nr:toll/interleukin-1 receptor domain-containing protein [uncultured Catenibacterium sp.]
MKDNLLNLIKQIDDIKSHFHVIDTNFTKINRIHDRPEFSRWKQELVFELDEIYSRTHDNFIEATLSILNTGFKGTWDEQSFHELAGSLLAIQKNIDKFYQEENDSTFKNDNKTEGLTKSPKIFISHSSLDIDYVSDIVELLEDLGIREDQLFCSSIAGYGIQLDEDIYDYLKQQFQEYDLHIIFVLSDNYYKSPACLNEMGATWVLQKRYTTILLPDFDFKEVKGAISPTKIAIKLDGDSLDVKEKLGQLKDSIVQEFSLTSISDIRWEKKRDEFISKINNNKCINHNISDEAIELLSTACANNDVILKTMDLSGVHIQVNDRSFIASQKIEEVTRWENALNELLIAHFVEARGNKGEIFGVIKKGVDFYKQLELKGNGEN